MPPCGKLGIDQPVVDGDFEAAASRWDQSDAINFGFKSLEEFNHQTGGFIGIVSFRAVLDRDLQHGF